jgi:hypothetical protein
MDDYIKNKFEEINQPMDEQMKKMQDDLASPARVIQEMYNKLNLPANFNESITQFTQPQLHTFEIPVNPNLASEFYKRLIKWIQEFDNNLDQEHEVGIRLVSFGQNVTFHLEDMGYMNPSLISFSGVTEDGEPVELIQHVSQISILLLKVKRIDAQHPKKPIGFMSQDDNENETP